MCALGLYSLEAGNADAHYSIVKIWRKWCKGERKKKKKRLWWRRQNQASPLNMSSRSHTGSTHTSGETRWVLISWSCQQERSLNSSCCCTTCRGVEQSELQNRFRRMRAFPANDYKRSRVVGCDFFFFHELVWNDEEQTVAIRPVWMTEPWAMVWRNAKWHSSLPPELHLCISSQNDSPPSLT